MNSIAKSQSPRYNQIAPEPTNWQAIRTVIGGFFLMTYLSSFYLWGNISVYVLSYFYHLDKPLSYGFIFLVNTLLGLSKQIGFQLGVYLFQTRRWNSRLLIACGGCASLTGYYMSSLTTQPAIFLFMYCMLEGIGGGACYFIALICAWEWYPESKGLVTGIILGGFGIGAFIFGHVSTMFVNPLDEDPTLYDAGTDITYYDVGVSDRVPSMFRSLVHIWSGLIFMALMLVTRKEDVESATVSEGSERVEEDRATQPTSGSEQTEVEIPQVKSLAHCLYSVRFWQFFAMMVLSNVYGTFFSYSFKPYGQNTHDASHQPISDNTLTWAAAIGAGVINGLARIVMGAAVDKMGFKQLFTLTAIAQLINSLVCVQACRYPALYFICILVNFWCLGGLFSIFPVAVTNVFGLNIGPQIYVWIMFGVFIASLVNLLETAYLKDMVGFETLFYLGSVTQILCLILAYYYEEKLDVERLRRCNAIVEAKPLSPKSAKSRETPRGGFGF